MEDSKKGEIYAVERQLKGKSLRTQTAINILRNFRIENKYAKWLRNAKVTQEPLPNSGMNTIMAEAKILIQRK